MQDKQCKFSLSSLYISVVLWCILGVGHAAGQCQVFPCVQEESDLHPAAGRARPAQGQRGSHG